MMGVLHRFETWIIRALVAMMALTIAVTTVELGYFLVKDLLDPPFNLLSIHELMSLFGFFMLILIGLELLETVKSYVTEQRVRVEAVFMVAMIAIARKVIVQDWKEVPPLAIVGLAALVLSLALGYRLTRESAVRRPLFSSALRMRWRMPRDWA